MASLEELGNSELLAPVRELTRLGLTGELSERLLYRIFVAAAERDDADEDSEAMLDAVAAHLIIEHDRRDVLPRVADVVFRRNRRGRYIHDLVWSFFNNVSAEALVAVAGYLLSDNERDVRLACKLLHLPDCPEAIEGRRASRDKYLAWLSDNRPFLYLTGEYFNYSSEPEALSCDLEARYLHREISPKNRTPKEPLTEQEQRYLAVFRTLPEGERELLSNHSLALHRSDVHAWREWLEQDAAEQVMAAQNVAESEAV